MVIAHGLTKTGRMTYGAFFIALGIVFPLFFHFVSLTGAVFLPMHFPVMLGGLCLSWRSGLLIGILTPLLSCFLTEMPPLAILPLITVELALYGAVAGWLYCERGMNCYCALLGAMLAGRLGSAVALALGGFLLNINLPPLAYVGAALLKGIPGIIGQLILLPLIVRSVREK